MTSALDSVASPVSENYPLSPVPENARKSIWSLAPLLMAFTLYSGTLFAGGLVAPAYFFPGIKPINGIISAIIFYFILSKIIPQTSRTRAI